MNTFTVFVIIIAYNFCRQSSSIIQSVGSQSDVPGSAPVGYIGTSDASGLLSSGHADTSSATRYSDIYPGMVQHQQQPIIGKSRHFLTSNSAIISNDLSQPVMTSR